MPYVVTEACTRDMACVEVCPVECFYDIGTQLVINPEECIDCGSCEAECPVEAIFEEDAVPEEHKSAIEKNRAAFEGGEKPPVATPPD